MTKIRVEYPTTATPAECWRLMENFGRIDVFNPHLSSSHILPGSTSSDVGAKRQCDFKAGRGYIREKVIAWEPGRFYTVGIFEGSMPVAGMQTTLGVEPRPAGAMLFMETTYSPPFGVLGAIMDPLVIRPRFRGMLTKVLVGLDQSARQVRDSERLVTA